MMEYNVIPGGDRAEKKKPARFVWACENNVREATIDVLSVTAIVGEGTTCKVHVSGSGSEYELNMSENALLTRIAELRG